MYGRILCPPTHQLSVFAWLIELWWERDSWWDFPLVAPKKFFTAKVVRWRPRQEDESGDIAVLQLQADLPEGAEAACFAEAEDFWNHPFRAFGFPVGQDDGVWATGQLLGPRIAQ